MTLRHHESHIRLQRQHKSFPPSFVPLSERAPSMPRSWQRSEYQQKGMSERAETAAARYGLTMADLQEHKIPCQWRSCYGNSYAVVKISEVAALSKKLKAAAAAVEEARMLELHGAEGLAKIRAAESAVKKAAEDKAKADKEQENKIRQLTAILTEIADLTSDSHYTTESSESDSMTLQRLGKTAAKNDFHLNASALSTLNRKGFRVGKRQFFDAEDVVRAARSLHVGYAGTRDYSNPFVPHQHIKNGGMTVYLFVLRRVASRFAKDCGSEAVATAQENVREQLRQTTSIKLARMEAAVKEHEAAETRASEFGNNTWMNPAALARMEIAEKEQRTTRASVSSSSSSSSSSSKGVKRKSCGGKAPRKQLAAKAARKSAPTRELVVGNTA